MIEPFLQQIQPLSVAEAVNLIRQIEVLPLAVEKKNVTYSIN